MKSHRFYKVLELAAYIIIVAAFLVMLFLQRGKPQESPPVDMSGISISAEGGPWQ